MLQDGEDGFSASEEWVARTIEILVRERIQHLRVCFLRECLHHRAARPKARGIGRVRLLRRIDAAREQSLELCIDAGTAVEFRAGVAAPSVVGDSAAVVLDGRYGSFGVGSNGSVAARWVILDTFVGGESIAP